MCFAPEVRETRKRETFGRIPICSSEDQNSRPIPVSAKRVSGSLDLLFSQFVCPQTWRSSGEFRVRSVSCLTLLREFLQGLAQSRPTAKHAILPDHLRTLVGVAQPQDNGAASVGRPRGMPALRADAFRLPKQSSDRQLSDKRWGEQRWTCSLSARRHW
jgi:hypothetical protein